MARTGPGYSLGLLLFAGALVGLCDGCQTLMELCKEYKREKGLNENECEVGTCRDTVTSDFLCDGSDVWIHPDTCADGCKYTDAHCKDKGNLKSLANDFCDTAKREPKAGYGKGSFMYYYSKDLSRSCGVCCSGGNAGGSAIVRVDTPRGTVKGKILTTKSTNTKPSTKYDAFLSIPYAEKPARFAKPQTKAAWGGEWDASSKHSACVAGGKDKDGKIVARGSEDCLYLKVLRKTGTEPNARLPVLFWAHGGGFKSGSANDYDTDVQADNLVSKGLIIVQPTYRVGAWGFFSSQGPDAQGNWAVWDLLKALQFTRENIASFGGDPNRITIMGQGAGGVQTSMLTLSPRTPANSYQRAIVLSASMFMPQVATRTSENKRRMVKFASSAGCDDAAGTKWNDGRRAEVVACLKGKTNLELVTAQYNSGMQNGMMWHPMPDGENGVYPRPLEELAKSRPNKPVVMGSTAEEMSWDLFVYPSLAPGFGGTPENFVWDGPANFDDRNLASKDGVAEQCGGLLKDDNFGSTTDVRRECEAYFGTAMGTGDAEYWWRRNVQVGSSYRYHEPISRDLRHSVDQGNGQAYLYSMDYVRQERSSASTAKQREWWRKAGAFHNLDIAYIEDFIVGDLYKFSPDKRDNYIANTWAHIISNFAIRNDPSVPDAKWEPLERGKPPCHLVVDHYARMTCRGFHSEDLAFWAGQLGPCSSDNRAQDPNGCIDWMKRRMYDETYMWWGDKSNETCRGVPLNTRNMTCVFAQRGAYQSLGSRLFNRQQYDRDISNNLMKDVRSQMSVTYTVDAATVSQCSTTQKRQAMTFDANPSMTPMPSYYFESPPKISVSECTVNAPCTLILIDTLYAYVHNIWPNWPKVNPNLDDPSNAYVWPGADRLEADAYVFAAYKQRSGDINYQRGGDFPNGFDFGIDAFKQQHDLLGPVAVSWLRAKRDGFGTKYLKDLGMGVETQEARCAMLLEKQLVMYDQDRLQTDLGERFWTNKLTVWLPALFGVDETVTAKQPDPFKNKAIAQGSTRAMPLVFPKYRYQNPTMNDFTGKSYTLAILRPDNQNSTEKTMFVHSLDIDVRVNNPNKQSRGLLGDDRRSLISYRGPDAGAMPSGVSETAYVLLMEQREARLALSTKYFGTCDSPWALSKRCTFMFRRFVDDYGLKIVGLNRWRKA